MDNCLKSLPEFKPKPLTQYKSPYKVGVPCKAPVPVPYEYEPPDISQKIYVPSDEVLARGNPNETPLDYQMRTGAQMFNVVKADLRKTAKLKLETLADKKISEKFIEREKAVYYVADGKEIELTNFILIIKKRVLHKKLTSSEEVVEVEVSGEINTHTVSVQLSQWHKGLLSKICQAHPEFRLNSDAHNAKPYFMEYASIIYEKSLTSIEKFIIYEYAGWEKIDGRMVYLSGNLPYCVSKRYVWNLVDADQASIYRQGISFLQIANVESTMEPAVQLKATLPLFLYSHIGYTAMLFKDAGCAMQFMLMLAGESGSYKTSICEELFQVFSTDQFINFMATSRAIEIRCDECRDMTVMLDDIFTNQDKDTIKKFSQVLRAFGDNAPRAKANATANEIERFTLRGAAIVTAENDINSQKSSRLRYLTVHVDKNSFNSERLRYFQDSTTYAKRTSTPSIMQKYFSTYIHFLENNYGMLVDEICQIDRNLAPLQLKFSRLQIVYKVLAATARIVLLFGVHCNAITEKDASDIFQLWLNTIQLIVLENHRASDICEPYKSYLHAIAQGIATGNFLIADTKEQYQQDSIYYGFYSDDKEKLYLDYKKSFTFVKRFYLDLGNPFSATAQEIHKTLDVNGISEGYDEKDRRRHLKKVSINKQTITMLCLRQKAIEQTLKNIDE